MGRPYRILMAENCEKTVNLFKKICEMEDCLDSWIFVSSVEQLEKITPQIQPDLILSDVSLSDGNSPRTLKNMRRSGAISGSCKVLGFSASRPEDIPDSEVFDSFIEKGSDPFKIVSSCTDKAQEIRREQIL